MSNKDMLGSSALAHAAGPLKTLIDRLDGPNGEAELEALNRFLRKENPWAEDAPREVAPRSNRHSIDLDDHRVCRDVKSFDDGGDHSGSPESLLVVAERRFQITGRATGRFDWSPKKVELYLDPQQLQDGRVLGQELKVKLAGKPVLPYPVVSYLLDHPNLIPKVWQSHGRIFFWGTIFSDSDGHQYVCKLQWNDYLWYEVAVSLHTTLGWSSDAPAAILVSR